MRLLLSITLLAVLAGSGRAQARGGTRIGGAHFEAVLDYDSTRDAERALRVAHAAWDATIALTGLRVPPRPKPLVVHLYATAAAYRAVDRRMTGGAFSRNGAFAHWDTLTAHVELAPRMDHAGRTRVGLTFQTLRLVAHEAAHLAFFAAMPNHRSHPEWLSEGIATNVTEIVLEQFGLIGRIEDDPYFCRNMMRVKALAAKGGLPTAKQVAMDDLGGLHWLDGYAVRWAFFRVLRTGHAETLRRVIASIRRLPETPRFGGACFEALTRTFDRPALDGALARAAKGFAPNWVEINRSLETAGPDWCHAAFPKMNALTWRIAAPGDADYSITGGMTFGTGRKEPQLNVLIDRQRCGFVSVAFEPTRLTVFEYDTQTKKWRRVHATGLAPPGAGRRRMFAVHRRGRSLAIDVAGARVLEASFPGRTLAGPWGLGVQAGGWGIWHDIRFEMR